jgi:adenine-specific DNA-methyltransferase
VIKYLGSKRRLLDDIAVAVATIAGTTSVLDLFSGTSRVGHHLKSRGYRVEANDHNAYAATLARCYVQGDREELLASATSLVAEFNALAPSPGYFTQRFCEDARYLQPKNGARVDAIRDAIALKGLEPELEAVLLTSLLEAADRVDSTTGVQMAYLKSWAPRAHNDLELRVPDLVTRSPHGKSRAHEGDALDVARRVRADVVYLDPPYNQHSYLGNYHVWESLVRWDRPDTYGVANKRLDVRERKSPFNSKPQFKAAFQELLDALECRGVVVSFSDEGFLTREEIETMLSGLFEGRAVVRTQSHDYPRYVGAQIGVHNLKGERVGEVSHLRNHEFLFVVSDPAA